MTPLNLYIPTAFMASGGLYARLERLVRALITRGHRVHFFSASPPPLGALWVPTPARQSRALTQAAFALLYPRSAQAHAREYPPDRIIAFGEYYAHLSAGLARTTGSPLLLFIRGRMAEEWEMEGRSDLALHLARRWERRGLEAADLIVPNSAFAADNLRNLFPEKRFEVVPNEIDRTRFHPLPDRAALRAKWGLDPHRTWIGCVGKFIPRKDPLTLVRATGNLPFSPCEASGGKGGFVDQGAGGVRLLFVGEGPLQADLEAAGPQVKVLPWQREMNEIYNAMDLLVMPSRHEGCPNVLLEALGAGLPCLGSDAGGVREVLADPQLQFPCGDSDTLRGMLARFRTEPAFAESVRAACRKQMPRYDFNWEERMVRLIEEG